METYITAIRKVIPVYHATKNRKLKGDVDSYLASANMHQGALEKNKRKKLMQEDGSVCSCAYSANAMEIDYEEIPRFDQKA